MPNLFLTTHNREKFNTSFESPNIELLESGKNWVWHHSEDDHSLLFKKAPVSLRFDWNFSGQSCSQFQMLSQFAILGLSKEVYNLSLALGIEKIPDVKVQAH